MMRSNIFTLLCLLVALLIISCEKAPKEVFVPEAPLELEDLEAMFDEDLATVQKKMERLVLKPRAAEQYQKRYSRKNLQLGQAYPFQPAGDIGGGVLEPGTFFPPSPHGLGIMSRGETSLRTFVYTTGLPPGAYTCWWVIFNEPDHCAFPIPPFGASCGGNLDELFNPNAGVTIYWATGGVVHQNGVGFFHARTRIGDDLGVPGEQYILGDGLTNPAEGEVHFIIKYHGPVSNDPAILYDQTHTLLGACDVGANAYDGGPVFGLQCFDPQVVIFPAR